MYEIKQQRHDKGIEKNINLLIREEKNLFSTFSLASLTKEEIKMKMLMIKKLYEKRKVHTM